MKWDEAAVEAAVRTLPVRTDDDVSQAVEMIRTGLWLGEANSLPRARKATPKQTMAELKQLCDLCRDLYDHIENNMQSPALRLVERSIRESAEERASKNQRPVYHPLLLSKQLEATFVAAHAAWTDVKNGDELPQPAARGNKPAARDVTHICANVFEAVTGKPAARTYNTIENRESGPFVAFLGKIFEALGVEAKPAGQAKILMEKRAAKTG